MDSIFYNTPAVDVLLSNGAPLFFARNCSISPELKGIKNKQIYSVFLIIILAYFLALGNTHIKNVYNGKFLWSMRLQWWILIGCLKGFRCCFSRDFLGVKCKQNGVEISIKTWQHQHSGLASWQHEVVNSLTTKNWSCKILLERKEAF